MKYLLGKKKHMTQVFTEDGSSHAATVVKAGPVVVTQVKNDETDGYRALQFGFGQKNGKNISAAQKGHQDKAEADTYFEVLRERRFDAEDPELGIGDSLDLSNYETGDVVNVTGITKGKGFQGVVKRHGFGGGRRTHGGQKSPERGPGSIGATGPSRVLKGTKMAGRMGTDKTTIKNLEVLHIDEEAGEMYIKGGLPGREGTILEIVSNDN